MAFFCLKLNKKLDKVAWKLRAAFSCQALFDWSVQSNFDQFRLVKRGSPLFAPAR